MIKLETPHRIARLYYAPRVAGFALAFVTSVVLFVEQVVSWRFLPFAVLLFLVYPQLAYLHACLAERKKQAELQHLVLDSFLLGAWLPVIGFNMGLSFALLAAVLLNNTIIGGLRQLGWCIGLFMAGILVLSLLTGFEFKPNNSLTASTMGLVGILLYMNVVALLFHRQNVRMMTVMRENVAKRNLFESLAAAGLASAGADSLEAIADTTLDHLRRVLPPQRGVGLLVRARNRAHVLHCSAFRAIEPAEQERLLEQARTLERSHDAGMADQAAAGWQFVGHVGNQLEALFLLHGGPPEPAEQRAVAIFLQQFATALDNYALTARLKELANTDGLTGLANRARLDECLQQAVSRKRRDPGADFSLVAIDVNGLKKVNDTLGHEAGDRLIVRAARLLESVCRESDVVARVGGDEFVVLCPATRVAQATHLLGRLQQRLASAVPTAAVDEQPLSLSLGCADSSECDPEQVMKLADQRMYADKDAFYGRQTAGVDNRTR